jgi:hypothetical protein
LMAGFGNLKAELKNLGKHQTSSSCLYIKRLADVDLAVLEAIVARGVVETRALETAQGETPRPKAKEQAGRASHTKNTAHAGNSPRSARAKKR